MDLEARNAWRFSDGSRFDRSGAAAARLLFESDQARLSGFQALYDAERRRGWAGLLLVVPDQLRSFHHSGRSVAHRFGDSVDQAVRSSAFRRSGLIIRTNRLKAELQTTYWGEEAAYVGQIIGD